MNWKRMFSITGFALACVIVTSGFFMYLATRLTNILSSPDWCGKAIQANRIVPGNSFVGLTACMDLLKLQVGSLSKALLIVIGTFALCLGVLVVIVIARAKLEGKLPNGISVDIDTQGGSNGNAA